MKMKMFEVGVVVKSSLLCLSLSGLALAGEGGGHEGNKGAAMAGQFFEVVDTNKDGQVTRAEADAAAQRLFERVDANKDNEVTREEAAQGAHAVQKEQLEAHFKALDTNSDGRVTLEESKMPAFFFERLDKNADKALTRDELQAAPELGAGRGEMMFKMADANGDAKVTRAEASQAALLRFDNADPNRDGVITRAEFEARQQEKANKRGKGKGGKGQGKSQR
jgi:hypothetical protein